MNFQFTGRELKSPALRGTIELMRNRALLALTMLAIVAGAQADGIKWSKTYASALATAKRTHRVMMVDFYADW